MSTAKKHSRLITEEEYLQSEETGEIKHEFVDGQIYAMAGAKPNHCKISGNVYRQFGNHLENTPCYPCTADMRLKTATGSHRYPDVLVICDDDFIDNGTQTPIIVVEVLSHSTRKTDEREKFLEYINIPTLQEYVLIEQDIVSVIVFRKSNDWRPDHHYIGEDVHFESIDLTLPVADIYHRVINDDMKVFLDENGGE
ncbi:MAG: Uma2 family endonuclease [Psychrosphaera sp.]|nr:Uma2 family endonuclease [Psychrosphaera sp.]